MRALQLLGAGIITAGLFIGLFQLNKQLGGDSPHDTPILTPPQTDITLPTTLTRDVLLGQWTRVGSRMGEPIPGRPEKTAIHTLVTYKADGTMHGRTWVPGATSQTEVVASGQWALSGNTLTITFNQTDSITSTLSITNNLLEAYTKSADLYVYYQKLK